MNEIQREVMHKAIRLLRGANCQFKIVCPTGEEFGELELAKKTKRSNSRAPEFARGERSAMIGSYLKDLQPNESASVPVNGIDPVILTSNVASWCWKNWGKGNSAIRTTKDQQSIQVIRLGDVNDLLTEVSE